MVRVASIALGVFSALACEPVVAEVIVISNAGFEDTSGQAVYNEFTFGTPAGWELHDPSDLMPNAGVYTGTLRPNGVEFFPVPAPEGDRVAILFNSGLKGAGEYGYAQTLAATLQPNSLYTLTVSVGNITSGTALDGAAYDLSNFPGYRIDFLAGGEVLKSENSLTLGEGIWGTSVITYTTPEEVPSGLNLGVRLVSLNSTNALPDNEVDFDNVSLTIDAVPEPGAPVLCLSAGLVLLGVRRIGRGRRVPQDPRR